MLAFFVDLVLVLLTLFWWWPLVIGLCRDTYSAGAGAEGSRELPGARALHGIPLLSGTRPPQRRLVQRGFERRAAPQRRWEGGFGRRGL